MNVRDNMTRYGLVKVAYKVRRFLSNKFLQMNHRSSQQQRGSGIRAVWACLAVVALVVQAARAAGTPWRETDDEERGKPLLAHHLGKRSFFNIECKGVYDKVIFARLDRICEDCYNLFREPQLHSLCMAQCFTTEYFRGCVESLQLAEEMPKFRKMIEYLAK
ncbi:CHH-like protein isoform X2 [Cylas formicarius]|uniref:CHH-like protein isoform X2 n=1 Tax=Cylas formicarius TaxID=197179 RepID=UPI0029589B0D|nr:CHH-like protein isoform X2 [Cylas formicarius]